MTRRRTWLFAAIMWSTMALGCALVVLVYEVYKIETTTQLGFTVTGGPWIVRDDEIGYVPRPNSELVFEHPELGIRYHAFTDRLGARVDDGDTETPDRVDVMILGCSFTWGLGVRNEDTYAEHLRQLLGTTVVNLAMGGYGSIQSLQRLRRNTGLAPKLVIYAFIRHHLDRNVSPCAAAPPVFCITQPYFETRDGVGDIHPPPAPLVSGEPVRIMTHDWDGPADVLRATLWALRTDIFRFTARPDQSPGTMNESVTFAVTEMARTTRAIGAQLAVLYIPYLNDRQPQGPPESLRRAVAENDVALIDLTPWVDAHHAQHPGLPLVLGSQDLHPNPLAHRLIAEGIAQHLRP
jgi:hypothetical protein